MLVLTRSVNESLIVEVPGGEKLEITLLETRGQQARIGLSGPKEVFSVLRSELQTRKGTEADGTNAP